MTVAKARINGQWVSLTAGTEGPQGPAGPTGATGATGSQGPQGATGATGSQGIQGIQGATGATGTTGSQGIQGVKGDKGDKGDVGAGLAIKGTITSWPPPTAVAGDMYLLGEPPPAGAPSPAVGSKAAGDGVVYSGSAWSNVGPVRGPVGPAGAAGAGLPAGGATGQFVKKTSATDYATAWTTAGITNADLSAMAGQSIKGNLTAVPDVVADLSVAQVKTLLGLNLVDNTSDANKPIFTISVRGMVPPPTLQQSRFLRDNGTWAYPVDIATVTWNNLTFLNSWSAYDAPGAGSRVPQYCKIGERVYLRGVVKPAAPAISIIAQLPAGYRPTYSNISFVSNADNTARTIEVTSSGDIRPTAGGAPNVSSYIFLDCIQFSITA